MKRIIKLLIPALVLLVSAVTAHAYNVVDLPASMPMTEALGIFNASEIVRATVYSIPDEQYIELDSNEIRNFFERVDNMTVYRTINKTPFRGTVINLYTANGAISYNLSSGVQIGMYGSDNYMCYKVRGEDDVTLSYIDTMYKDSVASSRVNGTELYINSARDFLRMPDADWAKESAVLAASKSLLPYELTNIYPNNISRQQFCMLLGNFIKVVSNCASLEAFLESRGVSYSTDYFTDCAYADSSVNMLHALGVVNGKGDGLFDPDGVVTREEAAAIMCRVAELFKPIYVFKNLSFTDSRSVSDWAQYSVRWVSENSVMNGSGNNEFQPQGMYTVEQAVATVNRLYDIVAD